MINPEVPPMCDPLGPENRLIFPGSYEWYTLLDTSRISIGTRVLKAEREFNRKAGFTNQDDRLPRFFSEEPLPPHNTVFTISDEELDSTFDF
jgi:aldehyde:ferredoxin oxidoreductase